MLAINRWREKKKDAVGFKTLKKLLIFLILLLFGRLLVNKMVTGKETSVWLCKRAGGSGKGIFLTKSLLAKGVNQQIKT